MKKTDAADNGLLILYLSGHFFSIPNVRFMGCHGAAPHSRSTSHLDP
jgi:hypothetical protein